MISGKSRKSTVASDWQKELLALEKRHHVFTPEMDEQIAFADKNDVPQKRMGEWFIARYGWGSASSVGRRAMMLRGKVVGEGK
jgi:hypothetical protein